MLLISTPFFFLSVFAQVLKKDLYFDPEFWNLIALRTNCLKLLSEKVVSSALEEIMEDKWILNYCAKETAPPSSNSVRQKGSRGARPNQKHCRKGDRLKEDLTIPSKRLRLGPGKTLFNVDHTVKRKNDQASRTGKGRTSEPLRRSFWQLDRLKDSRGYEDRRITRLSEKNPPKRRIRTPKWLLEDSGTLEKNNSPTKMKKHGFKSQKHLQESTENRSEAIQIRNNAKLKPYMNSESLREAYGKHQKGLSLDSLSPASPPQVILELSLPDNELFGMFSEDTCNRQRGLPQVLFYKPTMKHPTTSQPVKAVHRREVILRTRDLPMFVQQLHCYTRWMTGKGSGASVQGSVSKITRSSVQGMPSKGPKKNRRSDTAPEDKDVFVSPPPVAEEAKECSFLPKAQPTQAGSQRSSPSREHSKTTGADDLQSESEVLDNVLQDISTDRILQTSTTSKHREEFATRGATENKLAEAPVLEKGRHGQAKEPCEESAVEMKVTFASQTPTAGKFLESSVLNKVSKIQSSADVSAVSESVAEESCLITNTAGAISMTRQPQHSVLMEEQQLQPSRLPSQVNLGCPEDVTKVSNSGSTVPSAQLSDGQTSTNYAKAQGKGFSATSAGSDGMNDMSDFTEMVSEQTDPDVSQDLRHESRPNILYKSHTTSSCSVSEQEMSAVDDARVKTEDSDDFDGESTMNMEPVESEESRLEFCCTFCKKVFNGSRVVAHAMFHFRKDECMFCGTMFKDDLLAMMHLSDHIEKLKKSKEMPGNKVKEKQLCDTKDDSTSNSSVKANTIDICTGHRRRGRPRKTVIGSKPGSLSESGPCGSRKLRSNVEQEDEVKSVNMRTPGHKMNGNVAKNTVLERLKMVILNSKAKQPRVQKINQKGYGGKKLQKSFTSDQQKHVPKTNSKHNRRVVQEHNMEKVVCPVEGCTWAMDLSKNRVALLYHALEDHHGDIRPLKLAFCIGNSKCSICMRVLWSFEHFQHHVERHRLTPRHPCLHQGCTARFKTGIEMRRHTRKHSPLQAACCLPGCSKLFICLWALNLHEREHYSSKSTKPDKNSNQQTREKAEMNQQDSGIGDEPVDETACLKTPQQSRADPVNKSSMEKHKMEESLPKRDVLKNLSNKETSEQPAGPNLRLRRETKIHVASQKYRTLLKRVFSSSFLKRRIKARHKFKRQLRLNEIPKRRGRPPKLKEDAKTLKDKSTESNDNPEPKRSVNKKFRKNHLKQNGVPNSTSAPEEKKLLSSSSRSSKSKRQNMDKPPQLTLVGGGNTKDKEEEAENKDTTSEKSSEKNRQNVAELKKNNKRKHSHVSHQKTKQKDGSHAASQTAKLSLGEPHVEDKTDENDGTKQETFSPRSDSCETSLTDLPGSSFTETVPPSPATEEARKEESDLENANSCVRTSDSNKDDTTLNVTDGGLTKAAVDKDDHGEGGGLSSGARSRSSSVKMNGQVAVGSNSSVCIETLAEYGKKPYMRPPPTAYLDERYTTMPKRRKEMTFFHSSERVPVQEEVTAALQRQRCANCFATFSSTDELQAHLLLQKCSNLFGFDSDDEGKPRVYVYVHLSICLCLCIFFFFFSSSLNYWSFTGVVLFQATVKLFPSNRSEVKFWTDRLKCEAGRIIPEQVWDLEVWGLDTFFTAAHCGEAGG